MMADPPRVLVVVDDDHLRALIAQALADEGYEVRTAGSGRGALRMLTEWRPGVILLDLMMPEMDGFEVLERMRRHEAWRDIPVIVVTAKDLTREDIDRLNGHVAKVLQKGTYQRRDLVRDIQAMMARQVAHG
jgi:CheY-like chemotaxis protein